MQSNFEGTLLNPIRIKATNDHLLVLDKGDASVLRYSQDGTLLSRIGGRVGEGPGELQFLQDVDAGSADVVVLDSRTRLIHRFSMAR
ncbi:MAG: 6-bladed beta-propeller [Rhodothermales bacterium]